MARDSLCFLCQGFDFSLFSPAVFEDEYAASNRDDIAFLRDLDHLRDNPECQFCHLILGTLALSKEWPPSMPSSSLTVRLEVQPFAETLPLLLQPSSSIYMGRCIWVSVHPRDSPPEKNEPLDQKYRHYRHRISLNAGEGALGSNGVLFSGRIVPAYLQDFNVVSDWISDCKQIHKCEVPKVEFTRGMTFRLIDVVLECVVNALPDATYVALSYVWGAAPQVFLKSDTLYSFMQPGSLSAATIDLPATIRDAIHVCRQLNQRYAWVDALCIIQDSAKDKFEQINQMGNIYRCAVLTIIAACGKSCASGLTGISIPRPSQLQGNVAGLDLITIDYSVGLLFENASYNSRGWTFQEYALSHRLLVFLDTQIFFYCGEALWHEDTVLEAKHQDLSNTSPFIRYYAHTIMPARVIDSRWQNTHPNPRKVFASHFASLVTQFVSRNLSFESDTLNAFMGIASTFTKNSTSPSSLFHCGLPEDMFGLALLWATGPPLRIDQKRNGFSSWSWAGWKFEKGFWFSYGHADIVLLGVVLFNKCVDEMSDNEFRHRGDLPSGNYRWRSMAPDRVGFADGRVLTTTLDPSIQVQLGKTLSDGEANAALSAIQISGLESIIPNLVSFKTSHARIQVALSPYSIEYPYYTIGKLSGTCLDMAWRTSQPEYLDFILVALEGTPELQGPEYQLEICALVVEWIDGIAYRVSSCNVRQSDWLAASSQEKVILLG